MKFGFNQPSGFRGENVDIQRTTEAYLYYKLTNEPKGSGELIKRKNKKRKSHCRNLKNSDNQKHCCNCPKI